MLYRVEEGHIKTVGDAIWLAFVTMTTVGYGDYYPVTEGGRFISVILMVLGIGFLGLLTGSVASFFTKRKSSHNNMKSSIDISDLNDAEKSQLLSYLEFIRSKKS
jgi:voltage-gated potassium channel